MTTWKLGKAALRLTCPHCGAQPDEECVTTGGRATDLHAARWSPLGDAYREGYNKGRADGELVAETRGR